MIALCEDLIELGEEGKAIRAEHEEYLRKLCAWWAMIDERRARNA